MAWKRSVGVRAHTPMLYQTSVVCPTVTTVFCVEDVGQFMQKDML